MTLEQIYHLSQIALAAIAALAAVIAFRQLRASGTLEIFKLLQDERVQAARRHVYGLLESGRDMGALTGHDADCASLVCSSFDVAGLLIKEGYAPQNFFQATYAPGIQRLHRGLEPFIQQMRHPSRNGDAYWRGGFTWLYDQTRSRFPHDSNLPSDRTATRS